MNSPPKYALRFLRWYCREDYLDEIEGDLIELFEKRYQRSPKKAKGRFAWDVIRSFRPGNIKSFKRTVRRSGQNSNHTAMFQHTLLIAFRNFKKYKSSFLINLIGLSSGLCCSLLIYLWVNDELSIDKFYENDDRLYQVLENREQSYGIWTATTNSGPMAESLKEDMPEIAFAAAATSHREATLSVGEKNLRSSFKYVGKEFLNVFSIKLLEGHRDLALSDKSKILISDELALKLYGSTNDLIGKVIRLDHSKDFMISGVFKAFPHNSTQHFDFLLSIDIVKEERGYLWNWNNTFVRTFLLFKPGTDVSAFNAKIENYVAEKSEEVTNRTHFAVRFSDRYLYENYENGKQAGGRIEYVRLFSIIAIFILVIACINFTNLSTARASRRMKEVGIKKTVGANRPVLIYQYLSEAVFMALISLFLAVALTILFLPEFNSITQKQLSLNINVEVVAGVLGVTLCTGLLAGSYPAFYLAGFSPIAVLKGTLRRSTGDLWARKGLVVFQFIITIGLITSVLIVYKQMEMLQSKNLGYNKDQMMILRREGKLEDPAAMQSFLSELNNMPGVVKASSTAHDMTGHESGTSGIQWEGKDPNDHTEFENVSVNYGLMETLGFEMKEGRTFEKSFGDENSKIIFNETAVKFMGLKDPIGKTVKLWGEDKQIIGVAADFHFESLHSPVKPLFFRLAGDGGNMFMVKIEAGKEKEAIDKLTAFYETFNPGFPFEYRFLDQDYQDQYAAEKRVSMLSKYFAGLAIVISCLGLFGLAAFTAEHRLKEIGIRKILGSSIIQVVYMLSSGFSKMVLIAILVAVPLSYWAADQWLSNFAYRIDLEWWFFVAAGLLALLITWIVVAWQTFKVAKVNPVDCLKYE